MGKMWKPPFSINLLMITILLLGNSLQTTLDTCDRSECNGLYNIVYIQKPKLTIQVTNTTALLATYPKFVKVIAARRQRYTSYCYDGTQIDSNTGCNTNLITINPTADELRTWNKDNICPTGYQCPPDGECYGSWAKRCFSNATINQTGPKTLMWVNVRYYMVMWHTCVSSWSCDIFSTSAEITLNKKEGRITMEYLGPDNEIVMVDSSLYLKGYKTKGEYIHVLKEPPPRPTYQRINMRCYSSNPDNIKCVALGIKDIDGVTFNINNHNEGFSRNHQIIILSDIETVVDGKRHKITPITIDTNSLTYTDDIITGAGTLKASNIEDVKEEISTISAIQLQSLYNIVTMAESITKIENTINKIITETSKKDSNLMSNVIGEGNFATKWIDKEHFTICPCNHPPFSTDSNCMGEMKYQDGFFQKIQDVTECSHYDKSRSVPINVWDGSSDIDVTVFNQLEPELANSDSETWIHLRDLATLRLNTMGVSNDKKEEKGDVNSLIDSVDSYSWFYDKFIFVSCLLTWVILLSIIIRSRM